MNVGFRAVVELILAAAALVASALSWIDTRSVIAVAPVAEGQPTTMSVVYDPQQLLLTLLLATVAGIFIVVGVARMRRVKPTS
ncbi:MAG: hypothetical protein QOG19_2480 [Mycobacterium sp.]|nr:hypothetical protein [Mycobacterium sp.]